MIWEVSQQKLARNPLLLTIIAYLYTDTPFILPHSRAEFYQQSSDVLLRQWHREHNQFPAPAKRLILQHLALFGMDSADRRGQDRRSLDHQTVLAQVRHVLPNLNLQPAQDVVPILDEIVERSGLLLSIDGGERYQFAHFTLQEFFAAARLIGDAEGLIARFRADHDTWRETVKLWCGLADDSTALVRRVYQEDPITAFECLADAQKVDRPLVNEIVNVFKVQLGKSSEQDIVTQAFGAVGSDLRPRGAAVFKFLVETLLAADEPVRRIAAANALSLTNLPGAAGVFADHYFDRPEVREPLVRMGDLAVPRLAALAKAGSVEAMDDLQAIGTPQAAEELVSLLWHADQSLAASAAWRLAALLAKPNVENVLQYYPLTREQRSENWFDWIWQPFNESADSAVPVIAGRVAYLIDHAPMETVPAASMEIDPRLGIPLCSTTVAGETSLLTQIEPTSGLARISTQMGIRLEEETAVTLYHTPIGERLADVLVQPPTRPEFARLRPQLVGEILHTVGASPRWRYLMTNLKPNIQCELLGRVLKGPLPTRSDWLDIFRPTKYEFGRGWHYHTIVLFTVVISVVCLVQAVSAVFRSLKWPVLEELQPTLPVIGVVVIIYWVAFWRFPEPDVFLFRILLGPVGHFTTILEETQKGFKNIRNIADGFLGWLLSTGWVLVTGYFITISLLRILPWVAVVLVWLSALGASVGLWLIGKQRERAARNPLRGILDVMIAHSGAESS